MEEKTKMQRKFVYLGVLLLFCGMILGPLASMTTLVAGGSAPTWIVMNDGNLELSPRNGMSMTKLTEITAGVNSPVNGVKTVVATIDSTPYTLTLIVGTQTSGIWRYTGGMPTLTVAVHTISYAATDNAGLATSYTGTFTIYSALAGNWLINGQQITSTTQTVYSANLLVSFEFDKTAGTGDSYITCTVSEANSTLVTLTNSAAGRWTGTYTFTAGTHVLTLKASDGISFVSMSLFNFTARSSSWSPTSQPPISPVLAAQGTLIAMGVILIGYGRFSGKPKKGRFT
jgi:hypothetical protein